LIKRTGPATDRSTSAVGEENWFSVTFNGATDSHYHPHITISAVAGDDIRFDVFNYSESCSAAPLLCPAEGNSAATNITNWDMSFVGDANGIGCGDTFRCNTCSCTVAGNTMLPQAHTFSSVFIKVHRVFGRPTCNNYVLTVID
jgi:hypothetical protein